MAIGFFPCFKKQRFCWLDAVLYHYRIGNANSAVGRAPTLKSYFGDWTTYSHWYNWFQSHYHGEGRSILAGRMARGYVNSASTIYALPREDREAAMSLFCQHLDILPHSPEKPSDPVRRLPAMGRARLSVDLPPGPSDQTALKKEG